MIVEMKFNQIPFANANEAAGYLAAKRPEQIIDSIRQLTDGLAHLQFNDHFGGMAAPNRRRDQRGLGKHGDLFPDYSWVHTFGGRSFRDYGCLVGIDTQ